MALSRLCALCLALTLAATAVAHEVRPAYLEIGELPSGQVSILWKQPVLGAVALPLTPVLSSGWLDPETATFTRTHTFLTRRWSIEPPRAPIAGQRLRIEGLERSITDVMVRVVFADGVESTHMIKPDAPDLVLPAASAATPPVAHYLPLGIEHIWTGFDHLLFVLGLMLLVDLERGRRRGWMLLQTITAFTVAHSLTLAAAATGAVTVPAAAVEAVIAFSIVCLAVELVRVRRGQGGTAARWPWVVAFAFGLLHGFGFAGVLGDVGLPAERVPLALLLFNVGIEIGQLLFVGAALVAHGLLTALLPVSRPRYRIMPHVVGSLAAFWFIERTLVALNPS